MGAKPREGLAAEVLDRPSGVKELRRGEADFTPTDRDLAAYRDWAAGYSPADICERHGMDRATFYRRIRYTSDWVRDELIGDIQDLRAQQTALLMMHYRELKEIWDFNRVQHEPEDDPEKPGKKKKPVKKNAKKVGKRPHAYPLPVVVDQPLQIMHHMVDVLDSVAKINGLHKINVNVTQDDETEERVAGVPRSLVILKQIRELEAVYQGEAARETTNGTATATAAATAGASGAVIDAEPVDQSGDNSRE